MATICSPCAFSFVCWIEITPTLEQAVSATIEKRRIRFATIEGIEREDLPLAAEVWLDDLKTQIWVTRDALKLGMLFVRYMSHPRPEYGRIDMIERICRLDVGDIHQALKIMQIYGVIHAYSVQDGEIRVAMNLSLLQRLRVLECQSRLAELTNQRETRRANFPLSDKIWLPPGGTDVFGGNETTPR